ncbi:MAG TPA: histidine phosphatase family protein [Acidimicrobiia bacterium]|jgi:broad specificity phosphatase PhoE|nr:histidine phosphatase family protein [Acidimicrobiia bacterium]
MFGQPYPPRHSRKEIVLIRHAESQANLDGIWNGRTDGELSAAGERSLEALGERLSRWDFDAVISSPLSRARLTAEAFADDVVLDDDFIEVHLGRWEGMSFADVQAIHGEELREATSTRTHPMGGSGESLEQVAERALGAVDRLFEEMGDDEKVAVVTHGGFLQAVLHRFLPGDGRRVHAFTANTGITRIVHQFGRPRLASFNDTGHLGPYSPTVEAYVQSGTAVLALIRHGQTKANVEQRWQGRGDWELDEVGARQAELLGKWYGRHPIVYSSPLKRALATAEHVAQNGVIAVDDLMEIHMGEWEGLTTDEIFERWPDEVATIYRDGVDMPRGRTGEKWSDLALRVASAVAELEHSPDGITLVVAHGGAIRSFISSLTNTEDTHSESLFTPPNTSISHVALTERGPEIVDFGVATHLEAEQ